MRILKFYVFVSALFSVFSNAPNASMEKIIEIEEECWDKPLGLSVFAGLTLASSGTKRSLVYENAGVGMQTVPALHPYNPVDKMDIGAYPYMPVAIKIPLIEVIDKLPVLFQKRILRLKGTPCDFMMSIQSFPWKGKNKVLFRPQPWMWPNAKPRMKGTLKETMNLVALGDGLKKMIVSKKVVSAHGPGYTVFSGNTLCLGTAEDLVDKPLWTFATASVHTKKMRSVITLHLPMTNLQIQFLQSVLPDYFLMNNAPHLVRLPTMRSVYFDLLLSQRFSNSSLLRPLGFLMEKKIKIIKGIVEKKVVKEVPIILEEVPIIIEKTPTTIEKIPVIIEGVPIILVENKKVKEKKEDNQEVGY